MEELKIFLEEKLNIINMHKENGFNIFDETSNKDENISAKAFLLIHELIKEMDERFMSDPQFRNFGIAMISRYHGRFGFFPHFIGVYVLRHLNEFHSVDDTISWMLRLLSMKNAGVEICLPIWGVCVESNYKINDEYYLESVNNDDLNRSSFRKHIDESLIDKPFSNGLWMPPKTILVAKRTIAPVISHPEDVIPGSREDIGEMNVVASIMILIGAVDVSYGPYYERYTDSDMKMFSSEKSGYIPFPEILPRPPINDFMLNGESYKSLVCKYMHFDPTWRKKIAISLKRIWSSLHMYNIGNSAIELSIAYEVILSGGEGDGKNDISYRISNRAAKMSSCDFNQKKFNRTIVKKLYDLRSAMVHNGAISDDKEYKIQNKKLRASHIIMSAREIIINIIKLTLMSGNCPNFEDIDLL